MTGETPSGDIPSSIEGATIASFREEYGKADKFCQQVQDYISEAGIPALNELRNAGHHLLKAIDDNGALAKPQQLVRAINHAKRACYEAGEAGVLVALDSIRLFREEFRGVQVSKVIPDYIAMMAEAEKAREAVLAVRTDDEDRSNDYRLRMDAFAILRDIDRKLEAARPECLVLAGEVVTDSRRFLLNILLTLLGIAVAVALARYADWIKLPLDRSDPPKVVATVSPSPTVLPSP